MCYLRIHWRTPLQSQKVSHSLTFLNENFGMLSRNSSNTSLTKKRQKERLLLASQTPRRTPCCRKRSFLEIHSLHMQVKVDFLNNFIICEFYARSTSLAEKRQRKKICATCINEPVFTFWTIIEFTNYMYSSNTSSTEKRQKKKDLCYLQS